MNAPATCRLCGRPAALRFTRGRYRIHRCNACDFEFVDPVPSEAELRAVYERGYFSGKGHGYGDYFGTERAVTDAKARSRLDVLAKLGLRQGQRLLDFGCADGRFVQAACERGLDARGVENSPEARAAIKLSIRPRIDDSLQTASTHAPFAVVTLWDVLEHLPDPIATLRTLAGLLTPDAMVAVVLPVIDNVNARRWPRTWDQYKPPEHLWFFSRRSLRATLERELRARTIHESAAWERAARCTGAGGPAARIEAALWRAAVRLGAIDAAALVDSWMIVVQRAD